MKDFHHLYRALLKSGKVDRLFGYGQKHLAERIEIKIPALLDDESQTAIPTAILASFLASEVFSQLRWWLDRDMPYSPERMDEIFHQLVMPGFRFGLNDV